MQERMDWVDALKGASIIGVVLFHTSFVLDRVAWPIETINNELALVRMPAFFLASGMLTSFGLHRDWPAYFRRRVGPLVYIFVLWTMLMVVCSYLLFWPGPIPVDHMATMFIEPLFALWFIPALALFAILARLCAPAPILTVALASGYAAMFWNSDTGYRILDAMRYFAFFAAGAYFLPFIRRVLEPRPLVLMVLAATVYLAICLLPGSHYNAMTALVGVTLFASAMVVAARTPLLTPLSYVGSQSAAVYLMHMLVMANLGVLPVFDQSGVSVWGPVALALLGTLVPVWLRPQLPRLLFVAPELPRPRHWTGTVRPPGRG